jgi:hypothetical protein
MRAFTAVIERCSDTGLFVGFGIRTAHAPCNQLLIGCEILR